MSNWALAPEGGGDPRNYFGVGIIIKHGETTLQYLVRSIKDLDVIISHFDAYPLISQK